MNLIDAKLILHNRGYSDEESEEIAFAILEGDGDTRLSRNFPTATKEKIRRIRFFLGHDTP